MILVCGIPSEPPLAMVARELSRLSVPFAWINQRRFAETELELRVEGGEVSGSLRLGSVTYRLERIRGIYVRMMETEMLPELEKEPPDSPARIHADRLGQALMHWMEIADGRVVNRLAPMGSNGSKPYQAQLIMRYGFRTPESLITDDPDEVLEFKRQHGRVIYKSISGVRSIVHELEGAAIDRLPMIRQCPVQFQAYVPGRDVRVHVVGSRVFPTRIETPAIDYRYAARLNGEPARLVATELDDEWAQRCVDLAAGVGLDFAGIDLKITPNGDVYCFEVNPSPAYSYYESSTGQPIAAAVAGHLAGR